MTIGQKVIIKDTNSIWDGKEGILEEINDDMCTVFVNFIPEQHKRVRQDFYIDNIDFDEYTNTSEENIMQENLKKQLNEEDEGVKYTVKYWIDEEHRDQGLSDIYDSFDNLEKAKQVADDIFDDYAESVEVVTNVDTENEEVVYGRYPEEYLNGDSLEILTLAEYFGVEPGEIEQASWDDEVFDFNGKEYIVCSIYRAEERAREDIENTIDEMGLEAFTPNFQEWIIRNAVNTDEIEEWQRDSYRGYIDDIESESDSEYDNRLISEMVDAGILTEEDFEEDGTTLKDSVDIDAKKEEFADELCNREDAIDWLSGMYSDSELVKILSDNNLLDVDAIVEECLSWDGIAHFIASYDGREIDLGNGLFAYRIN